MPLLAAPLPPHGGVVQRQLKGLLPYHVHLMGLQPQDGAVCVCHRCELVQACKQWAGGLEKLCTSVELRLQIYRGL